MNTMASRRGSARQRPAVDRHDDVDEQVRHQGIDRRNDPFGDATLPTAVRLARRGIVTARNAPSPFVSSPFVAVDDAQMRAVDSCVEFGSDSCRGTAARWPPGTTVIATTTDSSSAPGDRQRDVAEQLARPPPA